MAGAHGLRIPCACCLTGEAACVLRVAALADFWRDLGRAEDALRALPS